MGRLQFTPLLQGHDTVECGYYLRSIDGAHGLDFEWLATEREHLRNAKDREQRVITLGDVEFMLLPHGTRSGYPFVILNADFTICFGEFNNPSFFVKFRSEALWREGALRLHVKFVAWAETLGLVAIQQEGLSRVDFTFDYQIPEIDFDLDSIVTLASKDASWRQERRLQSLQCGKGDVVFRIYDKIAEIKEESGKYWFEGLWGTFENVWRIEWQARKEVLKRFGIRTFQDLQDQQGDLLRYLVHEHDSLRIRGDDGNRSRWPEHPLWIDLKERIQAFNQVGILREIDPQAILEDRLMRIGIAMYGYAKRVAAIQGLRDGKEMVSVAEALKQIERLLVRVHDTCTWPVDVRKRMDAMRLGQW